MKAKPHDQQKLLTETELELMTIIWKLGEGSVADVMGALPIGRELAYTSISTILRILEQKQVLTSRKLGRGHVYVPVLMKDEYEKKTVKHVVEKVFDGAPAMLVKQLLGTSKLSAKELEEIRALLKAQESQP